MRLVYVTGGKALYEIAGGGITPEAIANCMKNIAILQRTSSM
jgi:hypothetical protein